MKTNRILLLIFLGIFTGVAGCASLYWGTLHEFETTLMLRTEPWKAYSIIGTVLIFFGPTFWWFGFPTWHAWRKSSSIPVRTVLTVLFLLFLGIGVRLSVRVFLGV